MLILLIFLMQHVQMHNIPKPYTSHKCKSTLNLVYAGHYTSFPSMFYNMLNLGSYFAFCNTHIDLLQKKSSMICLTERRHAGLIRFFSSRSFRVFPFWEEGKFLFKLFFFFNLMHYTFSIKTFVKIFP